MQIEVMDPVVMELEKKVDTLTDFVETIAQTGGQLTVDIEFIAHKEGCHPSQLRKGGRERYLLPRFGQSGYPVGHARWDAMEYVKWRQIPREERYRMYQEHLEQERHRYIKEQDAVRARGSR